MKYYEIVNFLTFAVIIICALVISVALFLTQPNFDKKYPCFFAGNYTSIFINVEDTNLYCKCGAFKYECRELKIY